MSFLNGATGLSRARIWQHVDAKGKNLGILSTRIAIALTGKYKPIYHPEEDFGDFVVVTNARHIAASDIVTKTKEYRWHTGGIKGKRIMDYSQMIKRFPTLPLMKAIYGKLPKNELRKIHMSRLKIFPDKFHPYEQNLFKVHDQWEDRPKISLADLEEKSL